MIDFFQMYKYAMTHDEVMDLYSDTKPQITIMNPEGVGADADTEFYFEVASATENVGIDYTTAKIYVDNGTGEILAYNGSTDSFASPYNGTNSARTSITDGFKFNFDPTPDIGYSKTISIRITIADNLGNRLENYIWEFSTTAKLTMMIAPTDKTGIQETDCIWRMDSPNVGTVYNLRPGFSSYDLTEYNVTSIAVSESELEFKRAHRLNGSNAYIGMGYQSGLDFGSQTLRMIVRIPSIPSGKHIIASRTSNWNGGIPKEGWAFWLEYDYNPVSKKTEYKLCWGGGSNYGPSPYQYHVAKTASNDILNYLPLNKWVIIHAWFYQWTQQEYNAGPAIYINGISVPLYLTFGDVWSYWSSDDAGTPNFYIGRGPSGNYLEMDIAEVQLTDALIPQWSSNYPMRRDIRRRLAKKPLIDNDTEALYIFDNDSTPGIQNSTVEDETGNHDGTVLNGNLVVVKSPFRNPNNAAVTDYDIGLAKNSTSDTRRIKIPHHANLNDISNGLTISIGLSVYGLASQEGYILEKIGTSDRGIKISIDTFVPNINFTLKDNNDEIIECTYDLRNSYSNLENTIRQFTFVYNPSTKTSIIFEGDYVFPNGGEATNSNFNHNNFGVSDDMYLFDLSGDSVGNNSFYGILYYVHWERRVKPLNEIFNDVRGSVF
jgi:hypothetical protein